MVCYIIAYFVVKIKLSHDFVRNSFLLTQTVIYSIVTTNHKKIGCSHLATPETFTHKLFLYSQPPSLYCGYYSHSIVPDGLGVRSYKTLFTPGTSLVMRCVMCCKSAKGMSSTVAVIASVVLTARRITG